MEGVGGQKKPSLVNVVCERPQGVENCILIINAQSEIQILNELYSKSSPIYCN